MVLVNDDSGSLSQEYLRLVPLLLMDFQFIEEGLKMYIARAYEIVRVRTRGFVPFELDYDTVAQEPLGRLISRYAPLTVNKALVERLKSIQPWRNHCAHQALLLTYEELHDAAFLSSEVSRLENMRQTTRECVQQVMGEVGQLSQVLSQVSAEADGSV